MTNLFAGLLILLAIPGAPAPGPSIFEAHDRVVAVSEFPAMLAADHIVVKRCMVLLPTYLTIHGKTAWFEDCTFVMLPELKMPFIYADDPQLQRVIRCKSFCLPARRAAEKAAAKYEPRAAS